MLQILFSIFYPFTNRYVHLCILAFFLLCSTNIHIALSAEPAPLKLDLRTVFKLANNDTLQDKIGKLEVAAAEQKTLAVKGKILSPRLALESYSGLVSSAEGDVNEPIGERESYNDLGPFFKIDLKIIQPLYTFGKYGLATDAGKFNVTRRQAAHHGSRDELVFEVTKAFLAMAAGHEGKKVGNQLTRQYQALIDSIKKSLVNNDPELNDSHLLETQSMLYEIEKQASSSDIAWTQASLLLKGLLNLDQNTPVVILPAGIPPFPDSAELLDQFLDYAIRHSWQLKEIEMGLQALKKKVELRQRMKYPDLFLAAATGIGRAPNRDKQTNPFITDDYNYNKLGAVVGLKWDFNFHVNRAKEAAAHIDYAKLQHKKKLAQLQIEGEMRKSYKIAKREWQLMKAASKSLKAAKIWVRLETDNMDMGLGEVKRLVSAYQQYFSLRAEEIASRYTYLSTLAQLAKSLGSMDLFLKWETNEKISLN